MPGMGLVTVSVHALGMTHARMRLWVWAAPHARWPRTCVKRRAMTMACVDVLPRPPGHHLVEVSVGLWITNSSVCCAGGREGGEHTSGGTHCHKCGGAREWMNATTVTSSHLPSQNGMYCSNKTRAQRLCRHACTPPAPAGCLLACGS